MTSEQIQPSVLPQVVKGVGAVIAIAAPPVVIASIAGTAGWNREHHEIQVNPEVADWPSQAQQFVGAHEAAHVGQKPVADWTLIPLILAVAAAYVVICASAAFRFGPTSEVFGFGAEGFVCTVVLELLIFEVHRYRQRRRERQADRAAAAVIGAAGLIQWARISQQRSSRSTRAVLAFIGASGFSTHPSWPRRIATARRAQGTGYLAGDRP